MISMVGDQLILVNMTLKRYSHQLYLKKIVLLLVKEQI